MRRFLRTTADQEAAGPASSRRPPSTEACAQASRSAAGQPSGRSTSRRSGFCQRLATGMPPTLPLQPYPPLQQLGLVDRGCLGAVEAGVVGRGGIDALVPEQSPRLLVIAGCLLQGQLGRKVPEQ